MKKLVVFLLTLMAFGSTLVIAQPGGRHEGPGRMTGRREDLKESLHLTDQQEAQVKKLHLGLERSQAEIQSKIRLARIDMKEIYISDKLDRSGIEKLVKQVSDLEYQRKMNFIGFWFSVNGILTPDQQKQWKQHAGKLIGEARGRFHPPMRGRGAGVHEKLMMREHSDGEPTEKE